MLFSAVAVPSALHADTTGSTGVPLVAGTWVGKLTSVYWDQTNTGAIHPKQRFKADVTVMITQNPGEDALAATINVQPGLPYSQTDLFTVGALSGTVGNFHLNLWDQGTALTIALSGSVNKNGKSMKITGVAASTDFTHEITLKLKLQPPH